MSYSKSKTTIAVLVVGIGAIFFLCMVLLEALVIYPSQFFPSESAEHKKTEEYAQLEAKFGIAQPALRNID